jgi:hypothetical protein
VGMAFPDRWSGKAGTSTRTGLPLDWTPPCHRFEFPTTSFLLASPVTTGAEVRAREHVDVAELRVAIGVLRALDLLGGPADYGRADAARRRQCSAVGDPGGSRSSF